MPVESVRLEPGGEQSTMSQPHNLQSGSITVSEKIVLMDFLIENSACVQLP